MVARQLTVVVLALVAAVVAPATTVATAFADTDPGRGVGIRLVDVPVAAADNPRARVYIIDHVRPGSVIERRVEVVNYMRHPVDVAIYPAAADVRSGDFIGAEGHVQNELSSWASVTPSSPRLGPGNRTFARVTIVVPHDAPQGEQYAAVWAEVTTSPKTAFGITQVSRVGVRIYLSVGPGGEPASDFTIRSFTAARDDDGAPRVQVLVRNTGGRALDLRGELRLSDGPGELSAGPFDMTLGTTLGIGETEPVAVALGEDLPDGPWRARVTVRSGLLERTASATLTFPSGPGTASPVAAGTDGGRSWLALVVAAAGFLILLCLLVWYLLRRRAIPAGAGPRAAGFRPPQRG